MQVYNVGYKKPRFRKLSGDKRFHELRHTKLSKAWLKSINFYDLPVVIITYNYYIITEFEST